MRTRTLSPEVKRFAGLYYKAIGTPLSLALNKALDDGDWGALAESRVNPNDYSSAREYFLDAQASALLRKLEDLPTPPKARRLTALANWKKGEASCFKTNERLAPYLEGLTHPSCDKDVYRHLVGIRKIVQAVLGEAPSLDDLAGKFGPGATFSDPAVRSTPADKMNVQPSMTPGSYWFLLPWQQTMWGRACVSAPIRRSPCQVRGNRFAVAPKDAMKDRAIAAEPSLNVYFQLSIGLEVRRRLKAVGIDLDNGQAKHMQVACDSSRTGDLATLDLSNASDTLAYALVRLLLPPGWFELFDSLRSPFTRFDDRDMAALHGMPSTAGLKAGSKKWWKLEKFSSMGNGFTFELESLIFFAIVHYVGMTLDDGDVETLVYGDDIICKAEIVRPVTSLLNFLGFDLNAEKSFWSGPFRESCGGDYFDGQAVRPYFMKESPNDPQSYIAAANAVRATSKASPCGTELSRAAWFHLLDQLPSNIRRIRGPESLGDLVVHDDESRWGETRLRQEGHTRYIQVYRPHKVLNPVKFRLFDSDVVYACAAYGISWSRGEIHPRDPLMSYKVGWIPIYGVPWTPVSKTRWEARPVLTWEGKRLGSVRRIRSAPLS